MESNGEYGSSRLKDRKITQDNMNKVEKIENLMQLITQVYGMLAHRMLS